MSVETIAIALHHSRASGTPKLVLVGIANHDGDGGAWPSIRTLVKYAGKSERTVQRALEELVALGEVVVHHNAGGDRDTPADRRPNLFELVLECPPQCDRTKHHRMPGDPGYGVTPVSPRRGKRGDASVTPRGDARVADGVTPAAPEPSLEPTTPQPPAPQGATGCTRHPDGPSFAGNGCRACGTTQRQIEDQHRRAVADMARAAATKAAADERAARETAAASTSPTARAALDQARQQITTSRTRKAS